MNTPYKNDITQRFLNRTQNNKNKHENINISKLILDITSIDETEQAKKLITLCHFFSGLLKNSCELVNLLSFDSLTKILISLNGSNRAFKALNILITRDFINPCEIEQHKLNCLYNQKVIDKQHLEYIEKIFNNIKKNYIATGIINKPHDLTDEYINNNIHAKWIFDKETYKVLIHLPVYQSTIKPEIDDFKFTSIIYDPKKTTPRNAKDTPVQTNIILNLDESKQLIKYPYDVLCQKIKLGDINDLMICNYEKNLNDDEFINVFCMTKQSFYDLPNWKRKKLKMEKKLF